MTLYHRCTLNDIGDLFYMLYQSNLRVQGSDNKDATPISRGLHLKSFDEYSVSHLYRELNMNCDLHTKIKLR